MPDPFVELELNFAHEATDFKLYFTYFKDVVMVHRTPDHTDDPLAVLWHGIVHYPPGFVYTEIPQEHRTVLATLAAKLARRGKPEFHRDPEPDPALQGITKTPPS